MIEDMIPLHQAYWQSRGRPGAFANPEFLSFHRRLISDGFRPAPYSFSAAKRATT
jgi:hypothetical protein